MLVDSLELFLSRAYERTQRSQDVEEVVLPSLGRDWALRLQIQSHPLRIEMGSMIFDDLEPEPTLQLYKELETLNQLFIGGANLGIRDNSLVANVKFVFPTEIQSTEICIKILGQMFLALSEAVASVERHAPREEAPFNELRGLFFRRGLECIEPLRGPSIINEAYVHLVETHMSDAGELLDRGQRLFDGLLLGFFSGLGRWTYVAALGDPSTRQIKRTVAWESSGRLVYLDETGDYEIDNIENLPLEYFEQRAIEILETATLD